MSSPSNASFTDFHTVRSLVLIPCNLKPRFLLGLHNSPVLQSIITFNVKSLRKNLLLCCFFELSTSSYLFFLYTESYLFVMSGKFL